MSRDECQTVHVDIYILWYIASIYCRYNDTCSTYWYGNDYGDNLTRMNPAICYPPNFLMTCSYLSCMHDAAKTKLNSIFATTTIIIHKMNNI